MSKNKDNKIEDIEFGKALSERYLSYALSTIMSRSLPSVRDGLKPVHRRLLYAMLQLHLSPNTGYKKCARIVGDVMGKYHPHGEVAIYDTLVRLAQSFSVRYPLIDGQGNFGSIDGDNAAAMRYTESRMTEICTLLMSDLDKDTVDFRPTYDNSETEPIVFPAAFPNILANGSEGIAVGMATSIPPHNLDELCEALIYLIDHSKASVQDILQFVEGPDLPTGGTIIDSKQTILRNYELGKGSFKVRAKWIQEEVSRGVHQIVITEIPYQIQKSKLIEDLADLLQNKKLPLVGNIRDESTDEVRIIIEPKSRSISTEVVMESLFKLTNLETRVQLNMNVIDSNNIPRVMNIVEMLKEFLVHRQNIITRRSKFLGNKIVHRIEIASGLRIAYSNLDKIIQIIRTEDEPKPILMQKFKLTDIQAEAILNMRLRSLRKLDEQEIIAELKQLHNSLAELEEILNNPKVLWKLIKKEIRAIQIKFSKSTLLGKRRTDFIEVEPSNIVDITSFIEKEPITIICSKMGWIRSIKGHSTEISNLKYKEGDEEKFIIKTSTIDKIIIATNKGKFYTILADNIFKGKGHGESLKLIVDIGSDDILDIFVYQPEQKILLVSTEGKGFITNSEDLLASTKLGKQIMNLPNEAFCFKCLVVDKKLVAIIGQNRKLLIFPIKEIPEMKRGQGTPLQRFNNVLISDIKLLNKDEGLSFRTGGNKIKVEKDISHWFGKRGGTGKVPPTGFSRDNKF